MSIANVFSDLLLDFDAEKIRVGIFYFDGASNAQKAGSLLGVRFPRTVTYHGGKQVVALRLFNIAKIPEIKVCVFVLVFQ